jgi:hypothetical protein
VVREMPSSPRKDACPEEDSVKILTFFAAAALVGWTAPAAAQFTTVIVPPKKEQPAPVAANPESPAADAAIAARITDMKAWVDSAAVALAAKPAAVAVDTTTQTEAEPPAKAAAQVAQETTEFRDGAPAPDTATPLPLLIVLGVSALAGGALIRRRQS